MIQGTSEWLAWRRKHIGASDQTHLNWCSPWSRGAQWLWDVKKELIPEMESSPYMQRGLDIENECRLIYGLEKGIDVSPAMIEAVDFPYLSASLDGMSIDGTKIIEIKYANSKDHLSAKEGMVPRKYIPQLCQQLYVTGKTEMDYCSYNGQELIILEFKRDDELVNSIIDVAHWFWNFLKNDIRPEKESPHPLFDTRPEKIRNDFLLLEADYNCTLRREIAHFENLLEKSNRKILQYCPLSRAVIGNLQIISTEKKGRYLKLLKGTDENEQL